MRPVEGLAVRQTSDAVSGRPPLTRADAVVLIGSPLLFVGLLAWAHLVQSDRPAPLLTRSTVMALSWLAVGPCLWWDVVRISQQFVWSRIEMCFEMECAELERLRAYPYDLRVGVELTLAIAVPIGVVLLERQLG